MKRSLCGLIMLSLLVALAGAAHPVRVSVAQDARPAGTLIKGEGPSVYRVMGDGTMRHVRDWATFLALGYLSQPVIQVMPDELASYQLTPPLTRWATGETDIQLYFMLRGKRYPVTDETTLKITGGTPADVSVWPDDLLNTYPVAADALTVTELIDTSPSITAAAWYAGALWAADDAGALRRLDGSAWSPVETGMEPGTAIHALEHYQDNLFAGTNTGDIWQVAGENAPWLLNPVESGPVTTLDYSTDARHWNARVGAYDFDSGHYVPGVGIGLAGGMTYGDEELFRHGTALAYDAENQVLWTGTSYAGLLRYDVAADEWENFTTLNSGIPDNTISDVQLADDGTIWIAVPGRIAHYHDGVFDVTADGMPSSSIALGSNGEVWLAGENAIGRLDGPIYTAFNTTVLLGSFTQVVLDDAGTPWFVSNRFTVHFDGQTWTAYPMYSAGNSFAFDPTLPPDTLTAPMVAPTMDYERWLRDWSRPAYDNGRCMHYLQYPAGDTYEIWEQVTRLKDLGVTWLLVNYTDRSQLLRMAPIFRWQGFIVVWRPFVRAYETYDFWAEDVAFLRAIGLPPYIQVYNEPNLPPEWDGQEVNQEVYLQNLIPAVKEVYAAGGYVGLQQIDLDWTRAMLQRMKAEGLDYVFDRTFFVPHAYGANHPPDYTEDLNGVLSFREFGRVFEEEIGYIPPMIAGEGGWRLGENADTRYPAIIEETHRDYHVAVFDWFRTGVLSDGTPLPDYLLAFCPWLLSDPVDPAAWYDSGTGDRALTIAGVEALPDFRRGFSWEE